MWQATTFIYILPNYIFDKLPPWNINLDVVEKKFVYFGIIYETINMIYGSSFSAWLENVLGA